LTKERILAIVDGGFEAPSAEDLDDITAKLTTGLASTDAALREGSMEVL